MSASEIPPSALDILAWDEERVVQLLDSSRVKNGAGREWFDISLVQGVDRLSAQQKEAFSIKFSSAVKKASSRRAESAKKDLTPAQRWGRSRAATQSPPPRDDAGYEDVCYRELLGIGGRPAMAVGLMASPPQDVKDAWVDAKLSCGHDVLPVFSAQLSDWMCFRQKWQWDNRGKAAGQDGFPAYLAIKVKLHLFRQNTRRVRDPQFDTTAKAAFDRDLLRVPLEVPAQAGFAEYARAVERRLASHYFTEPFQLLEDPRKQDEWTTWVEYLGYVYRYVDKCAAAMRDERPQYDNAWANLSKYDAAQMGPSQPSDKRIRALEKKIIEFTSWTEGYRRLESDHRRFELRARWVREELGRIGLSKSKQKRKRDW